MYSRILVAIDSNEVSQLALQEAIKLARDQQAKLRIIYVADEVIFGEIYPLDIKEYGASVKKHGQAFLKEMVTLAKKMHNQVESHLIEITNPDDNIPKQIIAEANKWCAEVIILGTHGRKGLARLYLGSIAEDVVRGTSIPVHIIHGNA